MDACPAAARPPATSVQQQLGAVLQEAMAPFLRDLRQTLASFRAQNKEPVETIPPGRRRFALQGLAEFLQEELGIPTSLWPAPPEPALAEGTDEVEAISVVDEEGSAQRARLALSSALAWAGRARSQELDLRRGPFQYPRQLLDHAPEGTSPGRFWSGCAGLCRRGRKPSRSGACPASSSNSKRDCAWPPRNFLEKHAPTQPR